MSYNMQASTYPEVYVNCHNGAGNGGKSINHYSVQFGVGHLFQVGSYKKRGFVLEKNPLELGYTVNKQRTSK